MTARVGEIDRVMFRSIVLSLVLVATVIFAASWTGPFLRQVFTDNSAWVESAVRRSQDGVTDILFRSAVSHGLLFYDPESDELRILTPREYRYNRATGKVPVAGPQDGYGSRVKFGSTPAAAANDGELFDADTTIDLLWQGRGAGAEIRREVETVNRQRAIVAVRDAGLTQPCPILAIGACLEVPWIIVPAPTGGDSSLSVNLAGGSALPPDEGVFNALESDELFGNWSVFAGADVTGGVFKMIPEDQVTGSGNTIVLNVVGRELAMEEGLRAAADVTSYCEAVSGADQVRFRTTRCEAGQSPFAFRVVLPRSSWTADSWVGAAPVQLPLLGQKLRNALKEGAILTESRRVRLSDRLTLVCESKQCEPQLATTSRVRRLARDLYAESNNIGAEELDPEGPDVTLQEPGTAPPAELLVQFQPHSLTPLVDVYAPGQYMPSKQALKLGLAQAIGVPGITFGTYLGLLENLPPSVLADELPLTFDPVSQHVALGVFTDFLVDRDFPVGQDTIAERFADERRAAFVLVDLDRRQGPGAVRVAVNYPFFNPNRSKWDLQSEASVAARQNTLTPFTWRGIDARFSPGSSMKMVSALSLARTAGGLTGNVPAERREQVRAAFFGASPAYYVENLGFRVDTTSATFPRGRTPGAGTFTVRDRGSEVYPPSASVATSCGRVLDGNGAAGEYGVCEALARSSNIWFSQMALAENVATIDAFYDPNDPAIDNTGLAQTFATFGFDKPFGLVRFPAGVSDDTFAPRMDAVVLPSAGWAGTGDRVSDVDEHVLNVGINAYGQNTQVPPLQMATIAGSIALGQRLSPYIAAHPDALAVAIDPLFPGVVEASDLFGEIRQGMFAVVHPGGTAHTLFTAVGDPARTLVDRVWAKTGSATIGLDGDRAGLFNHWLVGWVDDEAGVPRYAFACSVSHVSEGGPCSSLTAAILVGLVQEGRL